MGRPAQSGEDGIAAAAAVLLRASRVLVYGLADSTVEAQRAAVELTELLGGVIDPAGTAALAGEAAAYLAIGKVTATLGAARTQPELLVFWGMDPDVVHPDFRVHYLTPAPGAPPRVSLAVDVGDARGPADADERVTVEPEWEIGLLRALRASIRGRRVEPPDGSRIPEWPASRIRALARRLRTTRHGILYFEAEPPEWRREALRPVALGAMAMAANPRAHLRVIGVRRPGNAAGAEAVLIWQTGFPAAVDFAHGFPRYGPHEFDAEHVLARDEADAVLLVGDTAPEELSERARAALARLPVVALGAAADWPGRPGGKTRVHIRTRDPELTSGSVYRMDGVALRRRLPSAAPADAVLPTEEQVLHRLVEAVRAGGRP